MSAKLMFCTDLESTCDAVFASVLTMAHDSRAQLLVLHVLESEKRYSGDFRFLGMPVGSADAQIERVGHQIETHYRSRHGAEIPADARFLVRPGIPWLEILKVARTEQVDHILLGRPAAGADGCTPGENCDRVCCRADCQVSVLEETDLR